jgi:hypothetical protein
MPLCVMLRVRAVVGGDGRMCRRAVAWLEEVECGGCGLLDAEGWIERRKEV